MVSGSVVWIAVWIAVGRVCIITGLFDDGLVEGYFVVPFYFALVQHVDHLIYYIILVLIAFVLTIFYPVFSHSI